jgi:hypothetical protein
VKLHRVDERGETLLEIVIALVVMGLVVGAFFATYATQGSGSTTHRTLVSADAVLRGYAEATKSAVRDDCSGTPLTSFAVNYSSPDPDFQPIPLSPADSVCPEPGTPTPWSPIEISVRHVPNDKIYSLRLVVRSP